MSADGESQARRGEVGVLWARGPMVAKGYWRNPEATAATFVDGWVRTGDLARMDEDGYVYIIDRIKDMILREGEHNYTAEVEKTLCAHAAVVVASVVGLTPRQLGGEPDRKALQQGKM